VLWTYMDYDPYTPNNTDIAVWCIWIMIRIHQTTQILLE
jgi:hypothetical protein